MTTINITLNAPELTAAINMLLEALSGKSVPVLEAVKPVAVSEAAVIQAPVNPVPIAAAPSYTLDALARAGAVLAQSGKMEQALALLAKYGIQTVNQLKPEQYGAFATELRALGAQI